MTITLVGKVDIYSISIWYVFCYFVACNEVGNHQIDAHTNGNGYKAMDGAHMFHELNVLCS